jgi:hypothetical protein
MQTPLQNPSLSRLNQSPPSTPSRRSPPYWNPTMTPLCRDTPAALHTAPPVAMATVGTQHGQGRAVHLLPCHLAARLTTT